MLTGTVVSGLGEGARFVGLPWVRSQCRRRLGMDPYPGTLNLRLTARSELMKWRRLRSRPGVRIEPLTPEFCAARGFPCRVVKGAAPPATRGGAGAGRGGEAALGEPAAIILPEVPGYPEEQVELIAAVSLREALRLADGDTVTVRVGE